MKREKRLRARKKPAQTRSRETVDAVLEAAARILTRDGYARATTNRIAEKAGISVGSLYQYFPSKDAILVALVARHMDEVRARMLAALATDGTVEVRLERAITSLLEFHQREPELHRILVEEVPHPAELREQLDDIEEELVEAVEALSDRKALGAGAWLVVHAIETLTHHWALHPPKGVSVASFAAELAAMVSVPLRRR